MSCYQIVYSSRNSIQGTPEEIEAEVGAILRDSRRNNQRAGITGALLFNGQGFAQVLEGPMGAVENIYERIQWDERHSHVVLLSNGPCEQRTFSDWSMAYADPAAIEDRSKEPIDLEEICAHPDSGGVRILHALRQLVGDASK